MAPDILIVDDESDIRELVAGILQDEGYGTRTARDSDEALSHIKTRRPSLAFLDIWLQGSRLDGLQLLGAVKEEHPEMPVVMISGHGNIETAVSAIKLGAYDFIEKPFKADRLVLVASRALENFRLKREVKELKALSSLPSTLVGNSPAMGQLRQTIEKVAPTNSRILIVGASGSGKELAARNIHNLSTRANGPFVVINAAAITPERMETELFGVEGANGANGSNGAQGRHVGALEEAHGGTLFIDEIGDLPRETQNKILRVLVDQTFQRVGGTLKISVDVRIISSTGRNLEAEVAAGRFREDLYHRLSVVPIRVPPLTERREDIPDLVYYFVDTISHMTGLPKRKIGVDAIAVLQSHDWPGNVRQLRNNVERLMILAGGDPEAEVSASMLPQDVGSMVPNMPNGNGGEHLMGLPLRDAREVFEREYLIAQINRFGGNISRTAEFVGMERSALHRKLKALGID
jgi:two-component system nitrogen regulation response regulator NtrX